MSLDDALAFIRQNHRAVLATRRPDGSPQLSPIMVNVDTEGRLEISSTEDRAKVRNLRRDPACSVCVIADSFFGRWVQVDGVADIASLPEAMEVLVEYYRRLSGEHDDWDDYRRAMEEERRVLVRITPHRATPSG